MANYDFSIENIWEKNIKTKYILNLSFTNQLKWHNHPACKPESKNIRDIKDTITLSHFKYP